MHTTVIVVGGGIGGLATALALERRGLDCRVFEQSAQIRELGVGINTLPHAIGELAGLGLLERLDAVGLRTYELIYTNRFGQEIWRELRGLDAGHDVPQFSIHRGALQGVLRDAVVERLGPDAIRTGHRLASFAQDADCVTAQFVDASGASVATVRAGVLVGADGIHSTVRDAVTPGEGPPRWNGTMLWRGATDWPTFLTGRSMIIAGGMEAKVVLYPIAKGAAGGRRLTNWAVMAKTGVEGSAPPRREDWSRPGRLEEVLPHVRRFAIGEVDVATLIKSTARFYEYPVCDRDPIPRWSYGRVTLLGDAAHPMYPVGSNGASQAILDARALADSLADIEDVAEALRQYENARLGPTSEIVQANRRGGPEGVIDAVEALAPDGFEDVEAVLPYADREAIVRGYAQKAGFAVPAPTRS
ncbi:MAG: flavin-dependent oxidoreductase [Solirubrobacterales bacterium]|nr:flavin-dependent oxidoreductase [Solirubrobacterales bacterium]MBV9800561.1 flavin-dependent oxidoreductase [Solirubrobacterales bacterium]